MQGATPQQEEMVEQAARVSAQDNMELACAFIQKTAIEKAIPEIDKHLVSVSNKCCLCNKWKILVYHFNC